MNWDRQDFHFPIRMVHPWRISQHSFLKCHTLFCRCVWLKAARCSNSANWFLAHSPNEDNVAADVCRSYKQETFLQWALLIVIFSSGNGNILTLHSWFVRFLNMNYIFNLVLTYFIVKWNANTDLRLCLSILSHLKFCILRVLNKEKMHLLFLNISNRQILQMFKCCCFVESHPTALNLNDGILETEKTEGFIFTLQHLNVMLFFSESYQPVCLIGLIDFSDRDIFANIYHSWCSFVRMGLQSRGKINHFAVCVLRDHPSLNPNDHLWRQLLPAVRSGRRSALLLWPGPADR